MKSKIHMFVQCSTSSFLHRLLISNLLCLLLSFYIFFYGRDKFTEKLFPLYLRSVNRCQKPFAFDFSMKNFHTFVKLKWTKYGGSIFSWDKILSFIFGTQDVQNFLLSTHIWVNLWFQKSLFSFFILIYSQSLQRSSKSVNIPFKSTLSTFFSHTRTNRHKSLNHKTRLHQWTA